MQLSEISKEITFDAAHRVVGHKGKCARLHGHTYKVQIRCAGPVHPPGFVVDFGDLKEIVHRWDHMTLLWGEDPLVIAEPDKSLGSGLTLVDSTHVVRLPFNPTAENMAQFLAETILGECDLLSVIVTLWETPSASATAMVEKDTVMLK